MMIKTLLTATAAMALLAGGAHAGEGAKKKHKPADAAATQMQDPAASATTSSTMGSDTSVNPSATGATSSGMDSSATMGSSATSATSAGTDSSAVMAANSVTNGPVADTKENREKYKPLSRAGQRSAPRGN